jgi:hypothetical protein
MQYVNQSRSGDRRRCVTCLSWSPSSSCGRTTPPVDHERWLCRFPDASPCQPVYLRLC